VIVCVVGVFTVVQMLAWAAAGAPTASAVVASAAALTRRHLS